VYGAAAKSGEGPRHGGHGTITFDSLWCGPPFIVAFVAIVTVFTLLALGVIWIVGRIRRTA
jgi:hypothetical protein